MRLSTAKVGPKTRVLHRRADLGVLGLDLRQRQLVPAQHARVLALHAQHALAAALILDPGRELVERRAVRVQAHQNPPGIDRRRGRGAQT